MNTIRQTEKVDSNTLYMVIQKKSKNSLIEKNVKMTKRAHAFKGYTSSFNVEILNSFDPELQLKGTEPAT